MSDLCCVKESFHLCWRSVIVHVLACEDEIGQLNPIDEIFKWPNCTLARRHRQYSYAVWWCCALALFPDYENVLIETLIFCRSYVFDWLDYAPALIWRLVAPVFLGDVWALK